MTAMREWALQEAAQWVRSVRNDGIVDDTFTDAEDRVFAKRELGRIAFRLNKEAGIRACRDCGCTDDAACEEGCSWVGPDLCSACDNRDKSLVRLLSSDAPRPRRRTKAVRHGV